MFYLDTVASSTSNKTNQPNYVAKTVLSHDCTIVSFVIIVEYNIESLLNEMSTKQQQAAAQQAQQEQIAAQPQASHQQTMAHQLIQPAFDEQPEQYIYYQQIDPTLIRRIHSNS